jgi:hypothetical protein
MPTLRAPGRADLNFTKLLLPRRLDPSGIVEAIFELHRRLRYGGLDRRERWLRLFDRGVKDPSSHPIGLFDRKALVLPRKLLPEDEDGLRGFCRWLIDQGDDQAYIDLVLDGWGAGVRLDEHVSFLWSIRDRDRLFFEYVVRGRHGRALRRLRRLVTLGVLTEEEGRGLVFRQALLWVAHDIQMITCRARASMRMPLGGLATFTMLVVKAGTILRLMRSALAELKFICGQYQTADEEKRDGGPNGAEPSGLLAKAIGAQAKKRIEGCQRPVESYRAELDDGIPFVRTWLDDMGKALSSLDRYQAKDLPPRRNKDGELQARTNQPRTLHALWYSDLSPATGTAVGLFRLAIAELHLREMVDSAADAAGLEGAGRRGPAAAAADQRRDACTPSYSRS